MQYAGAMRVRERVGDGDADPHDQLRYYLDLKRPCRTPTGDALVAAIGKDRILQLERRQRGIVEVEDGCPIC